MTIGIALLLAGLMGAGGVALAAAAAHAAPGAGLESAAYMLLFHAAAVVAGAALLERDMAWRPALLLASFGWIIGAALFSGDISLRAFTGNRLFPMAAPTGGTVLILAWVCLSIAAIGALIKR
ncbi:MAG: DUF423 domain-containing protein [Hyphomicrobiales bacterium]|nr:MAG: DUF423 domain-containing protein [Hyphomicrobiales bacterium]